MKNRFTAMLGIEFPMIMAPMFLVSNVEMVKEAMKSGIAGTFPTLNFRKEGELENALSELSALHKQTPGGSYGVNLIVQKSNFMLDKHLEICINHRVPFYITSLGSPEEVISKAHSYGGKVFCDVVNLKHAKKCADLGCDGFIAVGHGAGGHAGNIALHVLVESLGRNFPNIPVIAAGGISTGAGIASMLAAGAEGVSVGTRFIATTEAAVGDGYKNGIITAGMSDIVLTEKLSGTPCTIIDTPYARKIGYKQTWFERLMNRNKTLKKYVKMIIAVRGMKRLEKSIKPNNYNNLWCAGQSVEHIKSVVPVRDVIATLRLETSTALNRVQEMVDV